MAVSILKIDLQDAKFREFKKLYDSYNAALKSAPAAWAMVNKNIDGSKQSFQGLVDKMAAANVQEKLRAKAQEQADRLTRTTAERWQSMARSSGTFLQNIREGTTWMLKWASISGVIGGLVGAGGLFGVDRLAASAATGRRSALGLGTSIGSQSAFGNFGRLVDPSSFLSSVADARFDVQKRVGLLGAGLSAKQIDSGDTASTAVALLQNLKKIADTSDPRLFGQILQSRRLDQFAGAQDLNRLRNTSPEEFAQLIAQFTQRGKGEFNLPDSIARKWQDLSTQLDNAGKSIETTLIRGLVNLAPGITKLSDSVAKIASTLLEKGGPLEKWVTSLGDSLEKFASYIGTPEFQESVRVFVSGLEKIGEKIVNLVSYFGDPDLKREHEETLDRVHKLREERSKGGATALQQLGRVFGIGEMTQDQLLGLVRQREGSGDSAVSPAGARGRYQIMPGTAQQYGGDPGKLFDPKYNEEIARKILADLSVKYHGNVSEILAAYNAGPGNANKYRAAGDNPAVLPHETQKYITGTQGLRIRVEDQTGGSVNTSVNALKD